MKTIYPYIIAILLSPILVYELEQIIVLLFNDKGCFLHDNIVGNVLLWVVRAAFFIGFFKMFYNAFLPKYSLIKDQMLDDMREEEEFWVC